MEGKYSQGLKIVRELAGCEFKCIIPDDNLNAAEQLGFICGRMTPRVLNVFAPNTSILDRDMVFVGWCELSLVISHTLHTKRPIKNHPYKHRVSLPLKCPSRGMCLATDAARK